MWLPGHLAFSFLLCIPMLVLVKRERLLALYFVAFFALLPDYAHLGSLRMFSHSLTGVALMLLISLAAIAVLFRPRPVMYVIAAVAALGHLAADLYIGSIHPFWPFDDTWYQLHLFNSPFDLATELMLSIIAIGLMIILFGPFRLRRSRRDLERRESRNLYFLAAVVAMVTLLQGAYYALLIYLGGGDVARYLLLLFFALPFLLTSAVLLPMTFSQQRVGRSSDIHSSGMRKL